MQLYFLDISFQISARLTVPAENTITENSEDNERAAMTTILYQFYNRKKKKAIYIFLSWSTCSSEHIRVYVKY